jgi:hypothetical protein
MRSTKSAPRLAFTALASLIAATACAGGPSATGGTPGADGSGGASHALQHGGGGGLSGAPTRGQSGIYTGRFSVAFARCMRAHGVPAFPDPDGLAGQLYHTGIDTHSVAFQDALYGPCKALAPAAWVAAQPLGSPPATP